MVCGCDETVWGPPRFDIVRRGETNISEEPGVISSHMRYIFGLQVDNPRLPALLIPDDAIGSHLGIAIGAPGRVAARRGDGVRLSPNRFGAWVPDYGGQDNQYRNTATCHRQHRQRLSMQQILLDNQRSRTIYHFVILLTNIIFYMLNCVGRREQANFPICRNDE